MQRLAISDVWTSMKELLIWLLKANYSRIPQPIFETAFA